MKFTRDLVHGACRALTESLSALPPEDQETLSVQVSAWRAQGRGKAGSRKDKSREGIRKPSCAGVWPERLEMGLGSFLVTSRSWCCLRFPFEMRILLTLFCS